MFNLRVFGCLNNVYQNSVFLLKVSSSNKPRPHAHLRVTHNVYLKQLPSNEKRKKKFNELKDIVQDLRAMKGNNLITEQQNVCVV